MNGPRRSSKLGGLALLLSLLALALAGYAAWAASQSRGADPAVTAQIDSLRSEIATMRTAVVPLDTTADSAAAAAGAVTPPGAVVSPPAPAGRTSTAPANRTTQP